MLTGDVITENARSNDVATRAEEPFQVGLVFGRITIVQLFFISIAQCLKINSLDAILHDGKPFSKNETCSLGLLNYRTVNNYVRP